MSVGNPSKVSAPLRAVSPPIATTGNTRAATITPASALHNTNAKRFTNTFRSRRLRLLPRIPGHRLCHDGDEHARGMGVSSRCIHIYPLDAPGTIPGCGYRHTDIHRLHSAPIT